MAREPDLVDTARVFGLRRLFDSNIKAARRRATEFVNTCHPTLSVQSARLRAEEPSRYVFAVFYSEPEVATRPARYKLVAVARQGDAMQELEPSPDSPHWVRGRK